MIGTTVNKIILLTANTLIDGGLLTILLSVWSIEDYSNIVKLITTVAVGALSIVRWILFFRDRKNGKKHINKN